MDLDNIPKDMNAFTYYGLFTLICVLFIVWIVYATFFHSRVIGYILTKFINLMLISKKENFKIGSIAISFLPGKFMLRDVQYTTKDYSIYINDGFIIFRWWIPLNETINLQESYSIHRIFCSLNGVQVFCYNQSNIYAKLALALECMLNKTDPHQIPELFPKQKASASISDFTFWLTFFPVMKFQINQARLVIGNQTLPNVLAIEMDESKFYYFVRPAMSDASADLFCEKIKGKASDLKIALVRNDRYTKNNYEWPPNSMDHKYTIATCPRLEFEYCQDKPGLLTTQNESTYPCWTCNANLSKTSTISYGPWADKNREYLYSFFFPTFYEDLTPVAELGTSLRIHKSFKLTINTEERTNVNVVFAKFKTTKTLNLVINEPSTINISVPFTRDLYRLEQSAFKIDSDMPPSQENNAELTVANTLTTRFTFIEATLNGFDANTSMMFKPFLKSKVLKLKLDINCKRYFNELQIWYFDINLNDPLVYGLYNHKDLITDLIDDWGNKEQQPDALTFVPFVWKFNVIADNLHLITFTNPYNYVDCSNAGYNSKNCMTALQMRSLAGNFALNFNTFAPKMNAINFDFNAQRVALSCILPDYIAGKAYLLLVQKESRYFSKGMPLSQESNDRLLDDGFDKRRWLTCWEIQENLHFHINYSYYPEYPSSQAYVHNSIKPLPAKRGQATNVDSMTISVNLDPSNVYVSGALLIHLLHFKENYFGEFQCFTPSPDEEERSVTVLDVPTLNSENEESAQNLFSLLDIRIFVNLQNPNVILQKACSSRLDEYCPAVTFQQITFLMIKTSDETIMKLEASPATLKLSNKAKIDVANTFEQALERPIVDKVAKKEEEERESVLVIDGIQFKARALFSRRDLSLLQESLEYAWIIHFNMGDINGEITTTHILQMTEFVNMLALSIKAYNNDCIHPKIIKVSRGYKVSEQPGSVKMTSVARTSKFKSDQSTRSTNQKLNLLRDKTGSSLSVLLEPSYTLETFKFCPITMHFGAIDLTIWNDQHSLNLHVSHLAFGTCNLIDYYSNKTMGYLTLGTSLLELRTPSMKGDDDKQHGDDEGVYVLNCGYVKIPTITIDIASDPATAPPLWSAQGVKTTTVSPSLIQKHFLTFHDGTTKRLPFLYAHTSATRFRASRERHADCGCYAFARCTKSEPDHTTTDFFDADHFDQPLQNFYRDTLKSLSLSFDSYPLPPDDLLDHVSPIKTKDSGVPGSGESKEIPHQTTSDVVTSDSLDNASFRSAKSSVSDTSLGDKSGKPFKGMSSPQWVILTGQMNRSIDKSPLFMSSYAHYLQVDRFDKGTRRGGHIYRKGINTTQIVSYTVSSNSLLTRPDSMYGKSSQKTEKGSQKFPLRNAKPSEHENRELESKPSLIKVKVKSFIEIQLTPLAIDILKSLIDTTNDSIGKYVGKMHCLNVLQNVHASILTQLGDSTTALTSCPSPRSFVSIEIQGVKLNCLQVCLIKERVTIDQLDELSEIATCTTLFIAFINKIKVQAFSSTHLRSWDAGKNTAKFIVRTQIDSVGLQLRRFENAQKHMSSTSIIENGNRAVIAEKNSKLKFRMLPLILNHKIMNEQNTNIFLGAYPLLDSTGFIIFEACIEGINVKSDILDHHFLLNDFHPILQCSERGESAVPELSTIESSLSIDDIWLNFPASFYFDQNKELTNAQDDWHIFTTTSASITAWVNPTYRLVKYMQIYKEAMRSECLFIINFLLMQTKDTLLNGIFPKSATFPSQLAENSILLNTNSSLTFFQEAYSYLMEAPVKSHYKSGFEKAYSRFKRSALVKQSLKTLFNANLHLWYRRRYKQWHEILANMRLNSVFLDTALGSRQELNIHSIESQDHRSSTSSLNKSSETPNLKNNILRRMSRAILSPSKSRITSNKKRSASFADKYMRVPITKRDSTLIFQGNRRTPSFLDRRSLWVVSLIRSKDSYGYMKGRKLTSGQLALPPSSTHVRTPIIPLKNYESDATKSKSKQSTLFTKSPITEFEPAYNSYQYETVVDILNHWQSLENIDLNVGNDLNPVVVTDKIASDEVVRIQWCHTAMRHLLQRCADARTMFHPKAVLKKYELLFNLGSIKINIIECYNAPPSSHSLASSNSTTTPSSNLTTTNQQSSITDAYTNLAIRRKRNTLFSINRHFSLQPMNVPDDHSKGKNVHHATLADIEAPNTKGDASNKNISSDRYYYYTMPSSADPKLFAFNNICARLNYVETFQISAVRPQFDALIRAASPNVSDNTSSVRDHLKCIQLPIIIYDFNEEGKYFCLPKLRIITNVSSFSHHINTSTLKLIYQIIWIMKNFYVVKSELEDKRNLYNIGEGGETAYGSSTNEAGNNDNYSKASKRRFGSKKERIRGKILTAHQGSRDNDSSSNSTSLSSFSMMDRELLENVEESGECGNTFIENLSQNDRASSNLGEDFGLSPLPFSSSSSNLTASSPSSSTSNSPSSHSKTSSDPSNLSIDGDELPDASSFHVPIIAESSIRDIMVTFYTDLGIRKNVGAKGVRLAKFPNDITSLIGGELGEDGDETICVILQCASTSILSLWQGIKDDTSLKRIIDLVDVREDNQDLDNARDFDADLWDCHNLAIESSCHISYIRLWFGVEGLNLQFELLNLLLNYDAPSIGHDKYQYNANGDIFALSKSVFMNCPQMSITLMESYSSLSNLLLNFNIVDTLMFYNLAKHSVPPVSGNLLNLVDERTKDSILLKFGDVKLEIPQHPIVLHEIFTRITTKLTETLNQFAFYFHQNKGESDKGGMPENPSSVYRSNSIFTEKGNANCSNKSPTTKMENKNKSPIDNYDYLNKIAFDNFTANNVEADQHIIVNIYWKEINFEAALLPSLKALYNLKDVHMYGVKREKIDISLNFTNHALILRSMILDPLLKLSPETHIVLPFVTIKAHYIWNLYGALQRQFYQAITQNNIKALVKADLEIGYFERSLTTDLLNNLVFIQKVFMKEVNELLQRLTGMEQPQIPKFIESKRQSITQEVIEPKATTPTSYLYMIHLKLKGLQLTASTPTNIALRFETSAIDFKLFNQIVQSHKESNKLNNERNEYIQSSKSHSEEKVLKRSSTKMYKSLNQRTFALKTLATFKFKISVSLGQMTQNQLYEEAESEYNPLAHFTTTISMKNTPKISGDCDRSKGFEDGTEVIMVGVQRPHLNVQALAVDKAILIYINYKTAYEYWNEQRAALKRDVQVATQQVMEKLTTPIPQQTPKTFTQLFLQLTIDNLGISLPLQKPPNILLASSINSDPDNYSNAMGNESDHSAFFPADDPTIYMVLTIEHSRIFAFSKDVFVCKGVFSDLCIRFSSDFDPSYDDWSPNTRIISQDKITSARIFCNSTSNTLNPYNSTLLDSLVCNSCHVKEGTYEVCSNTFSTSTFNPKWVLNINWNMRGVDFLANTYIGICLKNLIYTLTILTKEELEGEEIPTSTSIAIKPYDLSKSNSKSQTSTPKPEAVNNIFGDNMKTKTSEPKTLSPINQNLPKVDYEAMGKLGEIPLTFLKEYHDQARNLHLLKQLGADDEKIKMETGKLLNMESQVAVDYRHDIFRKLNKQSIKAALIKQPLLEDGISQRPKSLLSSHQRQNSIACTNEFGTKHLRHHKSSSFGGQVDAADLLKENDELTDSTSRNAQGQLDEIVPSYKQNLDRRQTRKGIKDNEYVYSPLHPSHSHPIELCNAGGGQSGEQLPESKIDFDLDVKVNIESGTFILFNDTKDMDAFKDLLCKEKTFFKTSSELCIPNVGNRSHMVDGGNTSPLGYKNQSQQTQYPTGGSKATKLDPNVKHDISTSGSYFNFPSQRQSLSILYDKIKNFIKIGALKYSSSLSLPGLDVKVKYSSHNITANLQHIHDKTPKASNDSRRSSQFLAGKSKVRRAHRSLVPLEDLSSNKVSDNKNVHVDPCAKSADLYIWVTIRTFIKENKLDPHILEFIEAVLEPLPMSDMTKKPPSTNETSTSEADKKKEKAKLSTTDANVVYVATTNFPVNVFVYLRVNPSSFRFSCLPVSRVECIIYLPSLDLIFTSKTLDNHPASQDFFQSHIPKRGDTVEMPLYLMKEYARAGSGISVILFLSKFSLEIFHPYGGITTKNPASTTFSNNNLNRDTSTSNSYNAENGDINGSGINVDKNKARKKFLSLDIDYIQINLMRKRTLADSLEKKGKMSSKASSLGCNTEESQRLTIYLSGLCDFGSASFKYDMRRLNEILVFPKAWYRKSIAKRILLGEHVSGSKFKASRTNPQPPPNAADVVKQQMKAHTINTATVVNKVVGGRRMGASDGASSTLPASTKINLDSVQFAVDDSSSSTSSSLTNELLNVDEEQKSGLTSNASSSSFQSLRSSDNTLDSAIDKQGLNNNASNREKCMDLPPSALPKSPLKWESLLILAIRFEKVAIQMNMGNVMGNVNWNSQGWESHSRVYIDSEHHKNVLMTFGLSESFLDAKSGIVGGDLEMKQFFQTFRLLTNPHLVQVRVADAMLHVLQVRLDYMGSTILIARISQINSSIKDDWDIISQDSNDSDKDRLGSAKNLHPRDLLFSRVRLHTTLKWDHFQLLICQSTQSDMQKMCMKIVEFFQHQFQSSVAMLPNLKKSLKPPNASDAAQDKTKKADLKSAQDSNCLSDVQRHYAYWLKIRKLVQLVTSYDDIKAKLGSAIKSRIAIILKKQLNRQEGHITQPLVLGGSFVFQGNHLSLACFYGINFRAKTWAIFSMREISVVFSSQNNGLNFLRLILRDFEEAQKSSKLIKELIQAENICPLTLNQNLLFQLGFPIEGEMMEKVKKSKKEMAIILKITRSHYIPPKSSTIQEWCFYAFCKSSIDEVESFPAIEDRKPVVVKDVRNVTAETIFSLPRLQINMKSEHSTSTSNDHDFSVPREITVKYDFLSEFEDHILVSVDAEVLAFLHDLVISYTNKNYATQEKVVARKASMSNTDIKSINQHSDIEDDRNFVCNTWRLEPTLRIMSWKGQHLEAYGVDYILHKLGFTHARLTIPKWIQRGSMDPLDKFISFTLYYVLVKSGKFGEFKLH